MIKVEQPILLFKNQEEWERWLSQHHAQQEGVWLQMYKKASGKVSVTYDEALDEALCYGWIDGLVKSYDQDSYIQKFTPRRSRSLWSKRNQDLVARLKKMGKMRASGLAEVEQAKKDGRWAASYDGSATAKVPEDFLKVLSKNKKAKSFFEKLNKTNVYAITWRLQTAKKTETREKRMKAILEMLEKGEKFH